MITSPLHRLLSKSNMLSGKTSTAASLQLRVFRLCLVPLLFAVDSAGNYSCPNSSSCGNLTAITYPFWLASGPSAIDDSHCGYLGYTLLCQRNIPVIDYGEHYYRVINISYVDHTITLADADVFNSNTSLCPRILHNFTLLDDIPLNYTTLDVNLTFFFDCVGGPPNNTIACSSSTGDNRSYAFRQDRIPKGFDFPRICRDTIVAPVLQTNLHESMEDNYLGVLQSGFQLRWSLATAGSCRDCERSGGRCGLSRTGVNTSAFICFCSDGVTVVHKCGRKRKNFLKLEIAIGIVVSLAVASIFFRFSVVHLRMKHNVKNNQAAEAALLHFASLAPKRYKYSEIKRMTKSFSKKLGQGGYGSVFKGSLQDGHLVAVKVLSKSRGNGEEFINEVASISRASHVNVVSLLGFCLEGSKMALVYDFMPNGSLEKFIFSDESGAVEKLGWDKMYEIALGIARGLEYLHRGCNTRIVHFDIKPHNILLDQKLLPKISDFGLAKLCPQRESAISMMVARGTPGYIAPELISRCYGAVSTKSDVYSYGMMVLEMVGGRKNFDARVENTSEIYFPLWIHDNLDRYCRLQVSGVTAETEEIARKMIIVGLWCIQLKPNRRPSMSMVVDMFEGSAKDLEMPPRPCP